MTKAAIIPSLPSCIGRMWPGERRFAERLEQKLDDNYKIWYDVRIALIKEHPDFVILHPQHGLLILEVKDWKLSTIIKATLGNWDILGTHGPKSVTNPLEQARRYTNDRSYQ